MVDRLAEERESRQARAEAKTAELWTAKVEAVREEWQGRLQAGLADAAAEAERGSPPRSKPPRVEG